jgi:hypothetical protein
MRKSCFWSQPSAVMPPFSALPPSPCPQRECELQLQRFFLVTVSEIQFGFCDQVSADVQTAVWLSGIPSRCVDTVLVVRFSKIEGIGVAYASGD